MCVCGGDGGGSDTHSPAPRWGAVLSSPGLSPTCSLVSESWLEGAGWLGDSTSRALGPGKGQEWVRPASFTGSEQDLEVTG